MGTAMVSAFLSMVLILTLAWRLDVGNQHDYSDWRHLMFAAALISLAIAFSGPRLQYLLDDGPLAGSSYRDVLTCRALDGVWRGAADEREGAQRPLPLARQRPQRGRQREGRRYG